MPALVEVESEPVVEQELKKHVAAIHIDNRLTLLERKLMNVLLMNAYPKLLSADKHSIRVKELADILGYDSHDRDYLKKALINLMRTVITWNILDKKGTETEWSARPLLVRADIKRSWFTYSFPPDLSNKLFNPDIYSRINLRIQKQFSSGYALALYENCLRYKAIGSTGWFSLDILRRLLGVGDNDYYADFRRFNSKILKPAVKQVNKASDIFIEPETRKEKRKVVAVRFLVKVSQQLSLLASNLNVAAPVSEAPNRNDGEVIRERMRKCGLHMREIDRFIGQHDAEYLIGNLDLVEQMHAEGRIRTTLRATTLDALRNDYRPVKTLQEPTPKRDVRENTISSAKDKDRAYAIHYENMRREFEKKRLQTALEALSVEQKSKLESDFIHEVLHGDDPNYRNLKPHYRKGGFENVLVKGCFKAFAKHRLLLGDASDGEFGRFLASNAKQS